MTASGLRSGEVAAAAGVNLQTLRYYERRGLIDEPDRSLGGHRLYRSEAVTVLRVIKAAQRLGFTLEEVADLLDAGRHHHRRVDAGLTARAERSSPRSRPRSLTWRSSPARYGQLLRPAVTTSSNVPAVPAARFRSPPSSREPHSDHRLRPHPPAAAYRFGRPGRDRLRSVLRVAAVVGCRCPVRGRLGHHRSLAARSCGPADRFSGRAVVDLIRRHQQGCAGGAGCTCAAA